ncbi:unnamed protein product [Chrysoparadoxa australica]
MLLRAGRQAVAGCGRSHVRSFAKAFSLTVDSKDAAGDRPPPPLPPPGVGVSHGGTREKTASPALASPTSIPTTFSAMTESLYASIASGAVTRSTLFWLQKMAKEAGFGAHHQIVLDISEALVASGDHKAAQAALKTLSSEGSTASLESKMELHGAWLVCQCHAGSLGDATQAVESMEALYGHVPRSRHVIKVLESCCEASPPLLALADRVFAAMSNSGGLSVREPDFVKNPSQAEEMPFVLMIRAYHGVAHNPKLYAMLQGAGGIIHEIEEIWSKLVATSKERQREISPHAWVVRSIALASCASNPTPLMCEDHSEAALEGALEALRKALAMRCQGRLITRPTGLILKGLARAGRTHDMLDLLVEVKPAITSAKSYAKLLRSIGQLKRAGQFTDEKGQVMLSRSMLQALIAVDSILPKIDLATFRWEMSVLVQVSHYASEQDLEVVRDAIVDLLKRTKDASLPPNALTHSMAVKALLLASDRRTPPDPLCFELALELDENGLQLEPDAAHILKRRTERGRLGKNCRSEEQLAIAEKHYRNTFVHGQNQIDEGMMTKEEAVNFNASMGLVNEALTGLEQLVRDGKSRIKWNTFHSVLRAMAMTNHYSGDKNPGPALRWVIDTMVASGHQPSYSELHLGMAAFCRSAHHHRQDKAGKAAHYQNALYFMEYVENGGNGRFPPLQLKPQLFSTLTKLGLQCGRGKDAFNEVVKMSASRNMQLTDRPFNVVVHWLCARNQPRKAEDIMVLMVNHGASPTKETMDLLVKGHAKQGPEGAARAVSLVQHCYNQHSVAPPPESMRKALIQLLRDGNEHEALRAVNVIEQVWGGDDRPEVLSPAALASAFAMHGLATPPALASG